MLYFYSHSFLLSFMLSIASVYFVQNIGFDCAFIVPVNSAMEAKAKTSFNFLRFIPDLFHPLQRTEFVNQYSEIISSKLLILSEGGANCLIARHSQKFIH
jgi:hypothetical protein